MQYSIIVGILTTLLSTDKVNAAELANKYEICTRTVMRYVEVLNMAGVPIISQKGKFGGIRISENFRLNSQYFTEAEYSRLIPAVKSYDLQDKTTQSIIDKLTVLSKNLRESYILSSNQLVVDTPMTQALQDKFALIQNAIVGNRVCNLNYHDAKGCVTTRDVEPYSLLLKDGLWYMYAYCRLRNTTRFFKITRIVSIAQTDQTFLPRPFSVEDAKSLEVPNKSPYMEFSFNFSARVLTDVEEWLGLDSVSEKDGKFTATANLPNDSFLVSRLLSFGKEITVTKPDYLVSALRKTLATTLMNYSKK